jgi:hypothetical protein
MVVIASQAFRARLKTTLLNLGAVADGRGKARSEVEDRADTVFQGACLDEGGHTPDRLVDVHRLFPAPGAAG